LLVSIIGIFYINYDFQPNTKNDIFENLFLLGDNSLQIGNNKIVSGNGTQQNPFLITDLMIITTAQGIYIKDITKYLKIENVFIIGSFNGIIIENSTNIVLENIQIHNSTDSSIILVGSNNIEIKNSTITNPGKYGIHGDPKILPEKMYNISIINSTIQNSTDTSIRIFGNNTMIKNNSIFDSNFRSILIHSPITNSVISENYIENSYMEAIHAVGFKNFASVPPIGRNSQSSSGISVINNEIFNMHEDGIEFQQGIHHSIIENNYIHDSLSAISINEGHMNGIELYGALGSSDYNIIRNNTIYNIGGIPEKNSQGIVIADSSNNLIENNSISKIPGWGTVILWSGDNFPIPEGNIIRNNTVFDARQWKIINYQPDSELDLISINTIIYD